MNINFIKNDVKKYINQKIKLKVYIGRNKYEYFVGKIKDFYNNIFTVETDKGLKSFAYSDVLIKNVTISIVK